MNAPTPEQVAAKAAELRAWFQHLAYAAHAQGENPHPNEPDYTEAASEFLAMADALDWVLGQLEPQQWEDSPHPLIDAPATYLRTTHLGRDAAAGIAGLIERESA